MKRSFIHILLCILLASSMGLEISGTNNNQPKVSLIRHLPGFLVRGKLRESEKKFSVTKAVSNGRGAERLDEYPEYYEDPLDENDDEYYDTRQQPPEAGWSKVIYKNPGVYGAGWGTVRRDPNFPTNPLHILVPKS